MKDYTFFSLLLLLRSNLIKQFKLKISWNNHYLKKYFKGTEEGKEMKYISSRTIKFKCGNGVRACKSMLFYALYKLQLCYEMESLWNGSTFLTIPLKCYVG